MMPFFCKSMPAFSHIFQLQSGIWNKVKHRQYTCDLWEINDAWSHRSAMSRLSCWHIAFFRFHSSLSFRFRQPILLFTALLVLCFWWVSVKSTSMLESSNLSFTLKNQLLSSWEIESLKQYNTNQELNIIMISNCIHLFFIPYRLLFLLRLNNLGTQFLVSEGHSHKSHYSTSKKKLFSF